MIKEMGLENWKQSEKKTVEGRETGWKMGILEWEDIQKEKKQRTEKMNTVIKM